MKDEKTSDDDYFILTLMAIAEEMKSLGITKHNNVIIAAGLPFARFSMEKDAFVKYLKRGYVEFEYSGKSYECNITDVRVFSQCYAAVVNRLSNINGEALAVDIGSKTIDVVYISNHKPKETMCFSIPKALINCTNVIQAEIYRQFNLDIPEKTIQKIMMSGKVAGVSDEIIRVVNEELDKFASEIEGKIKEKGFNPMITPIIYLGGGARIMRAYGKWNSENISYLEDVRVNASGYEFIVSQMLSRK